MDALNVTTVDTDAGAYLISEYADYDYPYDPLREADEMMFAAFQDGRYETVNTLAGAAGNAVQTWLSHGYNDDEIVRRFALWRAITGDQTVLVTRQISADQSTWYRVLGLVPFDANFAEWDRDAAALAVLSEFEAIARGEVYGFVVTAPSGETVESVWSFVGDAGRADMLDQARDAIARHAAGRVDSANLAGAGIVGVI